MYTYSLGSGGAGINFAISKPHRVCGCNWCNYRVRNPGLGKILPDIKFVFYQTHFIEDEAFGMRRVFSL